MAALVVVTATPANGLGREGARLEIFPGGRIPTVFEAGVPFWIGYGFASDPETRAALDVVETRFELDVDGSPAVMRTDLGTSSGDRKLDVAEFPTGLPAGWHRFAGRWYDEGRLILSSRAAVEFVEP
jgi:hypothetical protein